MGGLVSPPISDFCVNVRRSWPTTSASGPGVPRLAQWQRAYTIASRREDGVGDSRNDRWQRRLTETSRRDVRLHPVRLDLWRRLRDPHQRHLVVVGLYRGAVLERDLLHHRADAIDHAALHQVLGVQRVDDMAADVAGNPHLVHLDPLLGIDADLGDFSEVALVTEMERDAESGAGRQLAAPARLLTSQLEDRRHPVGLEAAAPAAATTTTRCAAAP